MWLVVCCYRLGDLADGVCSGVVIAVFIVWVWVLLLGWFAGVVVALFGFGVWYLGVW